MEQTSTRPGSTRAAPPSRANLYVHIGRGRDYAWSATSGGNDATDTFAVAVRARRRPPDARLAPLLASPQCLPFEVLERRNAWGRPRRLDARGVETLRLLRTGCARERPRHHRGRPVALTTLRATYLRGPSRRQVRGAERPGPDPRPARLPARRVSDQRDVQLALCRQPLGRLLQLGPLPRSRPAREPGLPGLRRARLARGGAGAPRSAGGRPALLRELERQAGARAPRGRLELELLGRQPGADADPPDRVPRARLAADDARRAGAGDGRRRYGRPARAGGAAVGAAGARAPARPGAAARRRRAPRLGPARAPTGATATATAATRTPRPSR